jgi:hypothetical protein
MKLRLYFSAFALLLFVGACSSVTVESDFDPEVDFAKFKTFRWYEGQPVPGDELVMYPLVRKRFIESITEGLTSKGLEFVEGPDADLVVVIHAGSQDRVQVANYGGYGWYSPWWGAYGGQTSVSYYEQGTVVIDLVEAGEKQLVWRGMGSKAVQRYDTPAEAKEAVDFIVDKILNRYPPN